MFLAKMSWEAFTVDFEKKLKDLIFVWSLFGFLFFGRIVRSRVRWRTCFGFAGARVNAEFAGARCLGSLAHV